MTDRILMDLTQYASWPARTGVQRTLLEVARRWKDDRIEGRFGIWDGNGYLVGSLRAAGRVIGATFGQLDESTAPHSVASALADLADEAIDPRAIEDRFVAFVLPEPTFQLGSLDVAAALSSSIRAPSCFLYFDALPLCHPEHFPRSADMDMLVTRYNRVVAGSDNVAFISHATKETFESRIARRRVRRGVVLYPGADGVRPSVSSVARPPRFVVVGTIEPRKRHDLILDTFEDLWRQGRDYQLVLIGTGGWESSVLERIRRISAAGNLVWLESASDEDVRAELSRSSAAIFVSEAEGYGLPALEALSIGCPIVVSSDLPALEAVAGGGQIRLDRVDVESLAAAVDAIADVTTNREARRAVAKLVLPSWKGFVDQLETWVGEIAGGAAPVTHGIAS